MKDATAVVRTCNWCGEPFVVPKTRGQGRRVFCSREHATLQYRDSKRKWQTMNPSNPRYAKTPVVASPGLYVEKAWIERRHLIDFLGGKCVVCGIDNPRMLQLDYIPGRYTPKHGHRHPRYPAYVRKHREDFQLLCANHHQEKTWQDRLALTGRG
jgi:hypothetical protein